jgi:hypothetical protein
MATGQKTAPLMYILWNMNILANLRTKGNDINCRMRTMGDKQPVAIHPAAEISMNF